MIKKKPYIIGLGEILWDVYPTGKKAGGAPINFVFHSIQMGASGFAISSVGDDENGSELLQMLKEYDILHYIPKTNHPTGTVKVTLKGGDPTYTIVENVAWDYIPLDDNMLSIVSSADAISFGTLAQRSEVSRNTIRRLIESTPKSTLKCFDINLRQNFYSKDIIVESLNLVNVLKLNNEELDIIIKMLDLPANPEMACKALIDNYTLTYLILTAGSKFSIVYGNNKRSHIPTPKVEKVIDTVGAGDAFLGAFIYSILTGKSIEESHQKAVEVAAFICTKQGGWSKYVE